MSLWLSSSLMRCFTELSSSTFSQFKHKNSYREEREIDSGGPWLWWHLSKSCLSAYIYPKWFRISTTAEAWKSSAKVWTCDSLYNGCYQLGNHCCGRLKFRILIDDDVIADLTLQVDLYFFEWLWQSLSICVGSFDGWRMQLGVWGSMPPDDAFGSLIIDVQNSSSVFNSHVFFKDHRNQPVSALVGYAVVGFESRSDFLSLLRLLGLAPHRRNFF